MKMTILGLATVAVIAVLAVAVVGMRPAPSTAAPAAPPPASVAAMTPAPAAPVGPSAHAARVLPPAAPVGPDVPPVAPPDVPARAEPQPPKGEPLPEFPATNPKNKLVPLTPDKKTIIAEIAGEGDARKVVRVGIACEVCLREGPLEQFLCKKGTKEHEAIVRVDLDAELVHLAIIAAGGKPGTPTGFVDPKTEEPKHTPEWIWDHKKKAPIPFQWVFAGSVFIKDPDNPNAKPHYGANSGDIFSISNFPYSTLEFPVQISKDEAQLTYEARTEKIPPLTSKVWVLLEVPPEKK
ncbi:MAG: hypothetical protein J0I06_15465 [Planctomycetes bacterium]|nr:hypothetical protein [Planctomycetota bacterium]